MGKESSNILESDIDCSAELNSTFDKVIFEMWDEESLDTIQNKLISFINLRYGDTFEEILRKDKNYCHLFKAFPMSSDGTADIPSSIKPLNLIVPLKRVITGNNTETKNVPSDKKSRKQINIVHISKLNSISQYKKLVPKLDVQKVIVEYSNNGVFVSRTNGLFICENSTDSVTQTNYNDHSAKGEKKTGKNNENHLTLNMRTKLNSKLKPSKASYKENDENYVPPAKKKKLENLKPYLPQNPIKAKTPSKNELEVVKNELQIIFSKEKITDDKIKDAPKIKIIPPVLNYKEKMDTTSNPISNIKSFGEIPEPFSEKNASVCKSTKNIDEKNTEDKATRKCAKNIEFNHEERSIIGKFISDEEKPAIIIPTPSVHSDDKCITSIEEDKEDKQFSSLKKNQSNSSNSAYKDQVKITNSQEKPDEIYSDVKGEDLMILSQQEEMNVGTYKVREQLEIWRNEKDVSTSSFQSEKVNETNKIEHCDTKGVVYLEDSEIMVGKELEGISISTTEDKCIKETNEVKLVTINDKKETFTKGDVDLKHSEVRLMNDFSNILEENQLNKTDEKEEVIKDFDLIIGNEEEYLSKETNEEEKLDVQKETDTKEDINLQHLEIPTNGAEQLITFENQKETCTKQDIDLKHYEMNENNEVEDSQISLSPGEKIQETNEPNSEEQLFSIRSDQENNESKLLNLRENNEETIGDIDSNSLGDIEENNIQQNMKSDKVKNERMDSNNETRSILEHKKESVYETILSDYAKMKPIDHKKQAPTNGNIQNHELNAEHVFINSNYTTKINSNTISSTKKSQETEEESKITYISTTDIGKTDNTSNFLVKVEYKKNNTKDNTQSMSFMKNEYLEELTEEDDKCLQVKRLPLENDDKLKNTPSRKRNRDDTDSEPNKYDLRSASVEDKKKKRRKYFGTTEIVTRSRLRQQF